MNAPQRRWLPLALVIGLFAPLFSVIAPAIALPPPLKAQIVTASSPAASAKFGGSMSMSSDGATMIVGSSGSAGGGDAAIYDCTDGAGCTKNTDLAALATRTVNVASYETTSRKLTITTSAAHGFVAGETVNLSGLTGGASTFNGNQIINQVTSTTFSIYVSSISSTTTTTSTAGTATVDLAPTCSSCFSGFGSSISISDNGSYALVGYPDFNISGNYYSDYPTSNSSYTGRRYGRAYLFSRDSSNVWSLSRVFDDPSPADYASFGSSSRISGDASTIAIGASGDAQVHIFINNITPNPSPTPMSGYAAQNSSWGLEKTYSGSSGNFFGRGVSISDDGTTLIMGFGNGLSRRALATAALTKSLDFCVACLGSCMCTQGHWSRILAISNK